MVENNAKLERPRSGNLVANEQSEVELNLVITTLGLEKIAGATVEQPLILEKFAVGDGNGNEVELNPEVTSLVNEKYKDYINSKYSNNNNIVIECVLRANAPIDEGFYIRELGIFDEDGDFIAHAKLPEQYRPPLEDGQIVTENIFNVNLQLQNTENVQVVINEEILATVDSVNRLDTKVNNLTSKQIHVKEEEHFPHSNNVQEALNSLYIGMQDMLEMKKDFLRMFLGVAMQSFNENNPLINNSLMQWMWCEGQELGIEEYSDLYSVLGNTWGGTSDKTFKLPDTRDRVLRNIGENMPWETQEDALQSHTHTAQQTITSSSINVKWSLFAHYYNVSPSYRRTVVQNGDNVHGEIIRGEQSYDGVGGGGTHSNDLNKLSYDKTFTPTISNVNLTTSEASGRTASETRVKSIATRTWMITKILI